MSPPVEASPRAPGRSPPRPRLPLAWIVVAAIIVATFYPGIMSNDSLASLRQARTLEFTSWHPPIMALIWSVLDPIVEGPALMLVMQAILYAIAAAKLCAEAFPGLMRKFTPWLVVPLFSLFPPVMTLNGMIWKDVWMSALLLLALAYLFRMSRTASPRRRLVAFAVVLAGCLLATAFRHNAVAATAGLLAGAVYFLWPHPRPWPRLLRACTCGVLLAGALMLLVSMLTRLIAQPAHVTTPILMHDIAGMIVNSDEPWRTARGALAVSPALSDTSPREFTQAIKRRYTPAAAGQILRTSRRPDAPFAINVYRLDHDADAVKRAWLALIKEQPKAYLVHRAEAFACLLRLCDRRAWAQHSYILNPGYVTPGGNGPVQGALRTILVRPAIAWMYSPAFWLALVLACGAYGLARPGMRPLLVFVGLSGLGLAVSLFFTSPIESYRYVHWVVLLGWILVWLLPERLLQRDPTDH